MTATVEQMCSTPRARILLRAADAILDPESMCRSEKHARRIETFAETLTSRSLASAKRSAARDDVHAIKAWESEFTWRLCRSEQQSPSEAGCKRRARWTSFEYRRDLAP